MVIISIYVDGQNTYIAGRSKFREDILKGVCSFKIYKTVNGSYVFIPGIGIKEVDDTGKAMRRAATIGVYHIDIRMPLHSQGRAWGDQWLNVEVIDDLNQPLAITMPPASRTSLDSSRGNRSGAFSQSGSSGRR